FDAAAGALAELCHQLPAETVPAELGLDEQVVEKHPGPGVPARERPGAQGHARGDPVDLGDHHPGLGLGAEQVLGPVPAAELEIVLALVAGVFLDEQADVLDVVDRCIAYRHDMQFSTGQPASATLRVYRSIDRLSYR